MSTTDEVREVIIIGGGPAGYTAALYAARAELSPLVIEGFQWGGQLMVTSDVENYPGYPDGVMGPEMMQDFRRQAERFGAEFVTDDVTKVDFSERPFRVWVDKDEYRAQLRHRRDRRERPLARARVRAAAPGTRRQRLRHLRRRLLQGEGDRRGRRRRLRVRGGALPHALRDEGDARPPPQRLPRLADHGQPRRRQPEDRAPDAVRRRGGARRHLGQRPAAPQHAIPARRATSSPRASSSRSATTPTRSSSSTSSTTTRTATCSRSPGRRRRTSPACSRSATCRTTCTARRSPPPARAVWARWTPSATSPIPAQKRTRQSPPSPGGLTKES